MVESLCNCATGCNRWVNLIAPTAPTATATATATATTTTSTLVPQRYRQSSAPIQQLTELCVSPCNFVPNSQADADCKMMDQYGELLDISYGEILASSGDSTVYQQGSQYIASVLEQNKAYE